MVSTLGAGAAFWRPLATSQRNSDLMGLIIKHTEKITDNPDVYKFVKNAFIDSFKKKFVTEINLLENDQHVLYAEADSKILSAMTYTILGDICFIYFAYTHYNSRKRNIGMTLFKYLRKMMEREPEVESIRYVTEWHNRRMIRISRYHLPFKPKQIIYELKLKDTKNEKV